MRIREQVIRYPVGLRERNRNSIQNTVVLQITPAQTEKCT